MPDLGKDPNMGQGKSVSMLLSLQCSSMGNPVCYVCRSKVDLYRGIYVGLG